MNRLKGKTLEEAIKIVNGKYRIVNKTECSVGICYDRIIVEIVNDIIVEAHVG